MVVFFGVHGELGLGFKGLGFCLGGGWEEGEGDL